MELGGVGAEQLTGAATPLPPGGTSKGFSRAVEAWGFGSWDAMVESTCLGSCLKRSMSDMFSAPLAPAMQPPLLAVLTGDVSVMPTPLLLLAAFGVTVDELSSCLSSAFCAMP